MAELDLLISGGTVVDPADGRHDVLDIGITAGRIVAMERAIPPETATRILDASGCYVAPGFIDFHAHVFWGVNWFAVEADPYCTANGVTTVVDCGSAGSINFPGFRRYIVEPARTRILAFVNVAQHGIQPRPTGELLNLQYADSEGACGQALQNADIVVGIKVRLGVTMVGDNGPASLDLALKAAQNARMRLMVHIGETVMPLDDILARMRPGDIITHCFHGLTENIVGGNGRLRPSVVRARERGVLFDLGHAGAYMMSFDIARTAMAAGFGPDTLSTDAFTIRRPGARDPGFDLPTIMSKFLALGWSLDETIAACTLQPARAMGWDNRIGRLAAGREADVTVFNLREGPVALEDTDGNTIEGRYAIEPLWTIRSGCPAPARFNRAYREPPSRGTSAGAEPPRCCG